MTNDQLSEAWPLDSPVLQAVVGLLVTVGTAWLAETVTLPRELVTAVLAMGVVLFAFGVWQMIPRRIEDPAFDSADD